MNNLLKYIFLLVNVISATTSTNNSSLPLPKEALTVGKNSSELIKRDEPITLVGGTVVQGIWINNDGSTSQRPCALSFPVKKFGHFLGFLTSSACSNTNFFVGSTEIGKVGAPTVFAPERGLGYTFVDVYPEYWSEAISRNITYSQCDSTGSGDVIIPLLPIPSQPSFTGFMVCAFGGINGGSGEKLVCGEILEFNVTIQVPTPGSDGKKFVDFVNVVKVNMTNDYDLGYMGAPVYIPLQVPNSTQPIANPVGQVVETLAQFNNEENQDKKIWYYVFLDEILKDGGLEIAVGNLSFLLPPNNTESSNASFSDNLARESNTSEVSNHLVKRQFFDLTQLAGRTIWVSSDPTEWRDDAKRCTLGFAVRKEGRNPLDHGFLVLGNCLSTDTINNFNGAFTGDLDRPERTLVGTIRTSDLSYSRVLGLNFAIVRLIPNSPLRIYWEEHQSTLVMIPPGLPLNLAEVNGEAHFAAVGTKVCATTVYSKIICGKVTSFAASWTTINPWRWRSFIRLIVLGVSPAENWGNLIKVRLDKAPPAYNDNVIKYDWGSPVYWIEQDNDDGHIVKPVGILFGYDLEYENVDDRCEMVYYMYCISINLIMTNFGPDGLQLIGTPE